MRERKRISVEELSALRDLCNILQPAVQEDTSSRQAGPPYTHRR